MEVRMISKGLQQVIAGQLTEVTMIEDTSGSTFIYVSIRHSGTQLAGGDEIQGLTLAGVGSGTTLNNIEVVGSNDDGIEIFGGAAVLTNILILNQRDDAIDLDEGYRGTITNASYCNEI